MCICVCIYVYIYVYIYAYVCIHVYTNTYIYIERDILKRHTNKIINLQDNKLELITKYRKVYSEFIESIDFDLLQQSD